MTTIVEKYVIVMYNTGLDQIITYNERKSVTKSYIFSGCLKCCRCYKYTFPAISMELALSQKVERRLFHEK